MSDREDAVMEDETRVAWDAAVTLHSRAVWTYARQCTGAPQEAAEVAAIAWLRLEQESRRSQLPADIRSWLIQQVQSESRSRLPGPSAPALAVVAQPDGPQDER